MTKQHIVRTFFLLFLNCHAIVGLAQSRFIHLGLEQGMTNGYVVDMAQDRQGRVGLATQGGLHCWDGYRFTVYDTENSPPFQQRTQYGSPRQRWCSCMDRHTS